MSEKINPCPNPKCKSSIPPITESNGCGNHWIYCPHCNVTGPLDCDSESAAVAAWNSIRFMPEMPERLDPPGIPCVGICTGHSGKFVELMSPAYDKFDPSSHVYIRGENRLQKAWEILRAVERTMPTLPEGE